MDGFPARHCGRACRASGPLVAWIAAEPGNRQAKLHHLLTALVEGGERVRVLYTTGHWLDVDSLDDAGRRRA